MSKALFPETTGAEFSPCGTYRYGLWRIWDACAPSLTFIMLNPSTADDIENDPTVERCVRRAVAMGYGGLRVANLFALRSTDPTQLYLSDDPVGPENDTAILDAAKTSDMVICAWGGHGNHLGRGDTVRHLLINAGVTPYRLVMNSDGTPKHPLYVAYSVQPAPW